MARRGWVAAEVGPDTWRRLSVYDDGWIELSGFARGLSDVRGRASRLLTGLGLIVVLVGLPRLLGALGLDSRPVEVMTEVGTFAGLLVLLVLGAVVTRWRWRDQQQSGGDLDQARREHDRGERLRSVPGAPRWRRAPSAAAFASWTEGAVHVDGALVRSVSTRREGATHVVEVTLLEGGTRTYRSPDRTLPELLGRFGRA